MESEEERLKETLELLLEGLGEAGRRRAGGTGRLRGQELVSCPRGTDNVINHIQDSTGFWSTDKNVGINRIYKVPEAIGMSKINQGKRYSEDRGFLQ